MREAERLVRLRRQSQRIDLLGEIVKTCSEKETYAKKNYFLESTIEANEARIDDLFHRRRPYRPVLRKHKVEQMKK